MTRAYFSLVRVSEILLLAAVRTDAVKFKDVSCDEEALLRSFLHVSVLHGTDIDTLRLAALRTDEMVMVMPRLDDLVDVACRAIDLVDDAELGEQREIAIDGIEGDVGMLLVHGGENLLRRGEGVAFQESIEDGAPLRGQLVAIGAQESQMIFCHRSLLLSRVDIVQ